MVGIDRGAPLGTLECYLTLVQWQREKCLRRETRGKRKIALYEFA